MMDMEREKDLKDREGLSEEKDVKEAGQEKNASDQKEAVVSVSKEEYERLKEQAQKAKEYYEMCLRIKADYENARKRLDKEREEFIKFAQYNLIKDFLSVLDDFERAYHSAKTTPDIDKLIKGLEMIGKDLYSLLRKYGVQEIEAEGRTFDPTYHEALLQEEREDVPDSTVIEVLQKGYMLHDKVLRPARVKVSKRTVVEEVRNGGKENDQEGNNEK